MGRIVGECRFPWKNPIGWKHVAMPVSVREGKLILLPLSDSRHKDYKDLPLQPKGVPFAIVLTWPQQ
jgi:hypothetical protein